MFAPLKQILGDLHNFFRFAHVYYKSLGINFLLGVRSDSTPINSQNFLTESIGPH
jgi:hypothetical protein